MVENDPVLNAGKLTVPDFAGQIKSDVERQGDFIRFLIKEVEGAAFVDIEDVVTFVKWLDDELSRLVRLLTSYGLIHLPDGMMRNPPADGC
jgi:hypothetical protein